MSLFHRAHYNIIASRINSVWNDEGLTLKESDGVTDRALKMYGRNILLHTIDVLSARLRDDNSAFDTVKFKERCVEEG